METWTRPPPRVLDSAFHRQPREAAGLTLTRTGPISRLAAAAVALLVLTPLAGLLWGLVSPPPDPFGGEPPDLATLLARSRALELLATSALLGVMVSTGATVVGGWLAWAEHRLVYPGRPALAIASLLPLAMPSYIVAACVASGVGPRAAGLPLATLVLVVVCAPLVQILVGTALARGSAAEEEAARLLGASPRRVFTAVVLPRMRPALALGAVISLLYAVSDFGAVAVLDCPVLTWRLYDAVRGQQLAEATLLGLALLGVTVPLFVVTRWVRGRGIAAGVANPRLPARLAPGPAALGLTYALHALVIGLGGLVPVVTLTGWVIEGARRGEPFAALWTPLADTALLSATGAVLICGLALAPAWVAGRERRAIAAPVEHATLLTSALPGVLLALGLVLAALGVARATGNGRALYAALTGSGVLLMAGYAVRFLAEGYAALGPAVLAMDRRQEESARVLGATAARWLARIGLPALAPGIGAAILLLALAILKELPVTLLLGGSTGRSTLAFRVWDRYGEALWHDAGAAGLLLVALSGAVVALTLRPRRRRR